MKPFNSVLAITGIFFLILAACATTRAYEHTLESWQGHTQEEVVRKWGPPTRQETLSDGGMELVYLKTNPTVKFARNPATGKTEAFYDCKTKFALNPQGTVIGYKFEGPNCRQ